MERSRDSENTRRQQVESQRASAGTVGEVASHGWGSSSGETPLERRGRKVAEAKPN